MKSLTSTIKQYNLLNKGEKIGVAVSGGMDSMSLLHYLNKNKEKYGIDIVAINIDHDLRQDSHKDTRFVKSYCEKNNIQVKTFKTNVKKLKEQTGWSLEQAARESRREVFDDLLKHKKLDKIFLGHHLSDQVETILLNVFRGSGLEGVIGMKVINKNYMRPMLNTSKEEINEYIIKNQIPYVTDQTNMENEFSRNYLRNIVIPLIKKKWPSLEDNIIKFSKIAKEDNEYIKKYTPMDYIQKQEYSVRIPLTYFQFENPVVNRIIRDCLVHLDVNKDFEYKHIEIIKDMAKNAKNGSKIDMPNSVEVYKEYDYITIISKFKQYYFEPFKLRSGEYSVRGFGKIRVRRTYSPDASKGDHIVDVSKTPASSMWRTKKEGDVFHKLGSGSKKLKDYMIDKKIPKRLRDKIPVLADGNEVYIVAGFDISEKVKIDEVSKSGYILNYETEIKNEL